MTTGLVHLGWGPESSALDSFPLLGPSNRTSWDMPIMLRSLLRSHISNNGHIDNGKRWEKGWKRYLKQAASKHLKAILSTKGLDRKEYEPVSQARHSRSFVSLSPFGSAKKPQHAAT